MELLDIIFAITIVLIIGFYFYQRDWNASNAELANLRRWYNRGYLTKGEITAAMNKDGSITRWNYNRLRNKVRKQKYIDAITQPQES